MSKSILIVEKDDYTALKLIEYLRTAGYDTSRAKSGQLAIGLIRSSIPDLVLLSTGLSDFKTEDFIDRMRNITGAGKVPLIIMTREADTELLETLETEFKERFETMHKPIALDKLRIKIATLLRVPDTGDERHLTSEVFIREGIIVMEIGGSLTRLDLVALKYRILDTAQADKTLTKRFYLIIYDLEKEGLTQNTFNHIFDFVIFFKNTPDSNFKILTSSDTVKKLITGHPTASKFEIVDNYIDGLNKLKSLYLKGGEEAVRVEFLQPESALFKDVFDAKGNLIKEKGMCFTQDELNALKRNGIKTLFYSRNIRVGNDRQIVPDEDVDVVLDAIRLTGIMVPEQLMDTQAKQRLKLNILIVNSNAGELEMLYSFFTSLGFPVKKSTRMYEALKVSSEMMFDLMIVDLELKDGRGLDLVRAVRERETGKSCHFILTGKSVQAEHVKEAVSLGVKGFLKSPFDARKLEQLVKK